MPVIFRGRPTPDTAVIAANTTTGPLSFQPPTGGVAANGKPILSWDQAAAQITRDGVSWSGVLGAPATVTYAYRSTAPGVMPDDTAGFQRFTQAQITATENALRLWADVANITFVRVGSGTSGDGAYSNNATILFGDYTTGADAAAAFAYYPGSTGISSVDGDVWVNISQAENANPVFGSYGAQTLAHEIGHAIGLSHPGDYNAAPGVEITYDNDAVYWQDARAFTIMSYFGSSATVGYSLNAFAAGPQLHDIAAVQRLYGANMNTRTGDTIYGFNSNTGLENFTILADGASPVFAIWDAGGNDTLDFSGYTSASEIDLREEAFSSVGPGNGGTGSAYGNIAIARGAVIENAIGGAGADTIIGNAVANQLTGNGGNDTITGNGGIDTSNYTLASTASSWHRNPDGTWTVTSGAAGTDTLSSVEFLHFSDRNVFLDRAYSTLSGDGTSDIFMRHSSGSMGVWFVNGSGVTGAAGLGGLALSWTIEGVADFSGDGRDDIFMRNSNGNLGVWFMNGATATGAAGLGNVDLSWDVAGLGDVNGDGVDDIVWWNANGSLGVWFMNNGAASGAAGLGTVSQATFDFEGIGDFNGEGRDDFLWRNTSGDVGIWFMNGGAATGGALGNIPTSWAIEGVGDFNGDGRDDILMRDTNGNVGVWLVNGTAATGAGLGNVDHTFQVAAIGDYNGDGRDDILWWNDNGSLGVWFMNGSSVSGALGYGGITHDWVLNPHG